MNDKIVGNKTKVVRRTRRESEQSREKERQPDRERAWVTQWQVVADAPGVCCGKTLVESLYCNSDICEWPAAS